MCNVKHFESLVTGNDLHADVTKHVSGEIELLHLVEIDTFVEFGKHLQSVLCCVQNAESATTPVCNRGTPGVSCILFIAAVTSLLVEVSEEVVGESRDEVVLYVKLLHSNTLHFRRK